MEKSKQQVKKVCAEFRSKGSCSFGDRCKNLHSNPHNENSASTRKNKISNEVCFHFRKGTCKYGSSCVKSHDQNFASSTGRKESQQPASSQPKAAVNKGTQPPHSSNSRPSVSKDIDSFWRSLHNIVITNNQQRLRDSSEIGLWMSCWQAAASGASGPVPGCHWSLLMYYRNVANTAKVHPFANSVIQVMVVLATNMCSPQQNYRQSNSSSNQRTSSSGRTQVLQRGGGDSSGEGDGLVKKLLCILDVVRDRLSTPESLQTLSSVDDAVQDTQKLMGRVVEVLSSPLIEFDKKATLFARMVDFSSYISAVSAHIPEHSVGAAQERGVAWSHAQAHADECSDEAPLAPWLGWCNKPTLGWLMSDSWHRAPDLRSVYTDEVQYAESLLRVWTLLTFYWGSGAVWPKCGHRQGGPGGGGAQGDLSVCNNPLTACCGERHVMCTSRILDKTGKSRSCDNKAQWRCYRTSPGHDAICERCLQHQQSRLAGGPGRGASTDVYDAVVDKEQTRREGSVFYLSGVQSRKPPEKAPNWRTSYRLQTAALVAVVRLSVAGEPLQRLHSLQWAEVVKYSMQEDNFESHAREQGRMAVRVLSRGDCSALLSEADTPLEPGTRVALIDLRVFVPEVISVLATFANPQFSAQLGRIPFMGRLIGKMKSPPPITVPAGSTIAQCVHAAIMNSEIECVRNLPQAYKVQVVEHICSLPPVQSLYGTQLEAFANSLFASIHCTQGPPGTGKSYVGVCLVLALMVIRKAVRQNGSAVGPILMLSYKNHALDEFLCDIVRFAPDLIPGTLIRSGKPENAALQRFAERNSPEEVRCQHELAARIANQRLVRKVAKLWADSARALYADHSNSAQPWNMDQHTASVQSLCSALSLLGRTLAKSETEAMDAKLHETPAVHASGAYDRLHRIGAFQVTDVETCLPILQQWTARTEHYCDSVSALRSLKAVKAANGPLEVSDPRVVCWADAWLQGINPPPRCMSRVHNGQCMKTSSAFSPYCEELHRCLSTTQHCPAPRQGNSVVFCVAHCCQATKTLTVGRKRETVACDLESLRRGKFCAAHACPLCLDDRRAGVRVKDGLYACTEHHCAMDGCSKAMLSPHKYCEDHCCVECVATGSVLNLSRCSDEIPFCETHKCALPGCAEKKRVTSPNSQHCVSHTCQECDACVDTGIDGCTVCVFHRCSHPPGYCRHGKARLASPTAYCLDHTCKVCASLTMEPCGPVVEEPPRNVCFAHPLCRNILKSGDVCSSAALLPSAYCAKHKVVAAKAGKGGQRNDSKQQFLIVDNQCCGVTAKKKRCKQMDGSLQSKARRRYYFCPNHLAQGEGVREEATAPIEIVEGVLLKKGGESVATDDAVEDVNVADATDGAENDADVGSCVEGKINGDSDDDDNGDEEDGDDDDTDEDEGAYHDAEDTDEQRDHQTESLCQPCETSHSGVIAHVPDLAPRFAIAQCCGQSVGESTRCRATAVTSVLDSADWNCPVHRPKFFPKSVPLVRKTASATRTTDRLVAVEEEEEDKSSVNQPSPAPPSVNDLKSETKAGTGSAQFIKQPIGIRADGSIPKVTKDQQSKAFENGDDDDYEILNYDDTDNVADSGTAFDLHPDEMDMAVPDAVAAAPVSLNSSRSSFLTSHGAMRNAGAPSSADSAPNVSGDGDSDEDGDDGNDFAVNDDQIRRREIGADNDDDDDEEGVDLQDEAEGEDGGDDSFSEEECSEEAAVLLISAWNWDMKQPERTLAAAKFLRCMSAMASSLRLAAEPHVMVARRERAEASAAALKAARVVGATVVGASKRLEAIRAAEPFAVVVEEACEVMEPTLISVLAVSSLRKLELVGDHRQLPAFVQQCWFNLESQLPSIKTSLFERLISGTVATRQRNRQHHRGGGGKAEVAEVLPCTVLDEQRRMRSSIADITRPDYDDIITITDHDQTARQCIGDVLIRSEEKRKGQHSKAYSDLTLHRAMWVGGGRHVPGVRSNVFFWSLKDHRESKNPAGMSACNEMEANAVAGLAKYLLHCGVPPGSITVITPYKGQKDLIIRTLRKEKCLPSFQQKLAAPSALEGNTVLVSTVDRYQGDENDIVILSLVRSRPGNQFVGLLNRFIVGVSRARLGFFIVGSVEAVTKSQRPGEAGPAHWNRLVQSLAGPPTRVSESNGYQGPRIGSELPLCCPRHMSETSVCQVATPKEFPSTETWDKLCSKRCTARISCGHQCAVNCHSPTLVAHTQQCQELVPRPCGRHKQVPLECCDVPRDDRETLNTALGRFGCKVPTMYQREECQHSVTLPCADERKLTENPDKYKLKPCVERVQDFIHPACGHVFKNPLCHERRSYEDSPPQCATVVKYTRPCGCVLRMPCHAAVAEGAKPPACMVDRNVARPRCKHAISLRCSVYETLCRNWQKAGGSSAVANGTNQPLLVECGGSYGRSETELTSGIKECSVPVHFRNSCGHVMRDVSCGKAFDYATGLTVPPRCQASVRVQCPLCQHCQVTVPCWAARSVASWRIWGPGVSDVHKPRLAHGSAAVAIHELGIVGYDLRNATQPPPEIMQLLSGLCAQPVVVNRRCGANHTAELQRHKLLQVLLGKEALDSCRVAVERPLACGHTRRVYCYAQDIQPPPPCTALNNEAFCFPCGAHSLTPPTCVELQELKAQAVALCLSDVQCTLYRCGHQVMVECHTQLDVSSLTIGQRLTRETAVKVGAKTTYQGLVETRGDYCRPPAAAPKCEKLVSLALQCGHVVHNVKCAFAFDMASDPSKAPQCREKIDWASLVCGHNIRTQCWVANSLRDWEPWLHARAGRRPLIELDSVHNEYGEEVQRVVLSDNTPKPAPLPRGVSISDIRCNHAAVVWRECGHSEVMLCSEAYTRHNGLCKQMVEHVCEQENCRHVSRMPCHEYIAQIHRGVMEPCLNRVPKTCTICNVNVVHIECSRINVECQREVLSELPCGHMAQWQCGADPDPRVSMDILCRGCHIPLWESLLTHDLTQSCESFAALAQRELAAAIPAVFETVSSTPINADLSAHLEARSRIWRHQLDALRSDGALRMLPVPPAFGSEEDIAQHCAFVFLPLGDALANSGLNKAGSVVPNTDSAEFAAVVQNAFSSSRNTAYGMGVLVSLLTTANLRNSTSNADGVVSICVGIAHHNSILAGVQPFTAKGRNDKAKRANMLADRYVREGHSCVEVPQTADNALSQRVYWIPGAITAVAVLELKLPDVCVLCRDSFTRADGGHCANDHFQCWGCFEDYVEAASAADAIRGFSDVDGNLLCPEPSCKVAYNLQRVAENGGPPLLFEAMMKLKIDTAADKRASEAVEVERLRARQEYEAIQRIQDADERAARELRMTIVEDILTLRCPRQGCRAAFLDFDGCFALTCRVRNCGAGFCAWCLADCGRDAHAHVANCPENRRGGVHGELNQFNEHHRRRRKRMVEELLGHQTAEVRRKAVGLMRRELADLGIHLNEAAPPRPPVAPQQNNNNGNIRGNAGGGGMFGGFFGAGW